MWGVDGNLFLMTAVQKQLGFSVFYTKGAMLLFSLLYKAESGAVHAACPDGTVVHFAV